MNCKAQVRDVILVDGSTGIIREELVSLRSNFTTNWILKDERLTNYVDQMLDLLDHIDEEFRDLWLE